jgi:hypothetical protein
MYLASFLAPWMLMYALSTLVMNHGEFFREYYGGEIGTPVCPLFLQRKRRAGRIACPYRKWMFHIMSSGRVCSRS